MEKTIGRPRSSRIHAGEVFGLLTAVKDISPPMGKQRWLLQCSCGTFLSRRLEVLKFSQKKGFVANCGCYTRDARSRSGKLKTEHGLSVADRRLYDVHRQMLQRCYNSKSKDFEHYGARGISVCQAWHDPNLFFAWAHETGYQRGLTIERRDVNGSYTPENCTWVPNEVQSHNTRRNVFLTIDGETKHLAAWARHFGVKWPTVNSRLNRGWDHVSAVSTPPAPRGGW